jgi:hypothetical protein
MAVSTLQGPAAMEQSESSCFQVVLSASGIAHRLIRSLDKFSCAGDCSAYIFVISSHVPGTLKRDQKVQNSQFLQT